MAKTDDNDNEPRDPGGRPIEMEDGPWRDLVEAVGGVTALAEACGVSRSTIARWGDGTQVPHQLVRRAVDALAASHGVAGPFAGSEAAAAVAAPKRPRKAVSRG